MVSEAPSSPAATATVGPSESSDATGAPQRDGWTAVASADGNPYAAVVDVYDGGDLLVAFGQADRDLLGVWLSSDGSSWAPAAEPPAPPDGYGGRIVDVLRTSAGGLIAVARLGLPEGSEPLGSALFSSSDGSSWHPLGNLPTEVRLSTLATEGERVFAGGSSGIWYSDDAGVTWRQSAGADALGGQVLDLTVADGAVLAVGFSGTIETQAPELWTSESNGEVWNRSPLGTSGAATHAAALPGGSLVIFGSVEEDAIAWRLDTGQWRSAVLGPCCVRDAADTPSGVVAVAIPYNGAEPYVVSTKDGSNWVSAKTGTSPLVGISWSDRAGLLAASDAGEIVLGPTPYP